MLYRAETRFLDFFSAAITSHNTKVMPPKPETKPDSPYFEPGSAVEVSFDDDGFSGVWFPGTIVRRFASGRFLVEYQYHNLIVDEQRSKPLTEVLSLHKLRPQPPPESCREFNSGDRVDAFHNEGWSEGHVSRGFGNERFGVHFKKSKEHIVFPKEKLRIHREWINHNWVPPLPISKSPNHNVSTDTEGKETEKLTMEMKKRQRTNGRDGEEERDRLSDLPDCVLLHILKSMHIKDAIQTCVLSKRWKNLWKRLTDLSFYCSHFSTTAIFNKFVSHVLSSRDGSISLHSLDFLSYRSSKPKLLNMVIEYALLYNVQQLTMDISLSPRTNFELLLSIFSCRSLTSLKLIISFNPGLTIDPKSLQLPALETLHLGNIGFTTSDNDCAEPFSTCNMLDTLVLERCHLHNDAKVLCISNSTISNLTIIGCFERPIHRIELLTPNLSSFTCINPNFELLPCIFSCWSLTSLKLFSSFGCQLIRLPESLQLPVLKTLHLTGVDFAASDCVEPFSTCNMLDTLVLVCCHLHNDAKVLCISNFTISTLTICGRFKSQNYKIELSTPNLSSFTIKGDSNHQLFSTCNLSFLEEVYIDAFNPSGSTVISWLQVLANVKILTFSSSNLEILLNDLSTSESVTIQPPCFVRLESLKVKMQRQYSISDEEINSIVKYLLQNSPMARVDVIKC